MVAWRRANHTGTLVGTGTRGPSLRRMNFPETTATATCHAPGFGAAISNRFFSVISAGMVWVQT